MNSDCVSVRLIRLRYEMCWDAGKYDGENLSDLYVTSSDN